MRAAFYMKKSLVPKDHNQPGQAGSSRLTHDGLHHRLRATGGLGDRSDLFNAVPPGVADTVFSAPWPSVLFTPPHD